MSKAPNIQRHNNTMKGLLIVPLGKGRYDIAFPGGQIDAHLSRNKKTWVLDLFKSRHADPEKAYMASIEIGTSLSGGPVWDDVIAYAIKDAEVAVPGVKTKTRMRNPDDVLREVANLRQRLDIVEANAKTVKALNDKRKDKPTRKPRS